MRLRRGTFMRARTLNLLAGSGLLLLASTNLVHAQSSAASGAEAEPDFGLEEIIVTARRKDESLQDVPTTINAVSGADIEKLNFRKFEDIAAVVPGLSMSNNPNGIGASAAVRGVAYDVNASGNNGTVEFYLNDAPISAGNLFQTIYDVQQVELLRGPQGTLRGRAAPSGSMTVTTRRADLSEMGGYVSATGTDIGGYNGQGAINFPIISDKLAIRIAGAYEENEGNRVTSINDPTDPSAETKSGRATINFEPTDNLQFQLTYQNTQFDNVGFDQVESQQVLFPNAVVNPGAPGSPPPRFIRAEDRLSVADSPRLINQDFENFNLQAQWAFAGQRLNYVGARNEQTIFSFEPTDIGNFFPETYPAFLQGYGQATDSEADATAHELRLSSEERIGGMFSYIVGAFYQKLESPTDLTRPTPVLLGAPSPTVPGFINLTNIARRGSNTEKSAFANLTAQLGDANELSAGVRYIEYQADGSLAVNGTPVPAATEDREFSTTIFNVSFKHNFSEDLMAYATVGSSWRPGISATGDFSVARSPLENSFLVLPPEESESYEIGVKADGLDNRLRSAVSVYHQKFDNFPYRSASGVNFVNTQAPGAPPNVTAFNFVAAVPVEVTGVEADISFAPTADWEIGAVAAYSKGEIQDGFVPCNDFFPTDGIPDSGSQVPTVGQIRTATNGDNIAGCTVNYRASLAPVWSGSLQSEYRVPISATLTGYARGLLTIYGDSKNDPANAVDDYEGYELFNLYLGVRDPDGKWDVSLYGKNLTETEDVLVRSSTVMTTNPNNQLVQTNYYGGNATSGLGFTAPREFGLIVRYAFGSR